ncbi:MAG: DUF4038 domain-containing protein [Ignisphaera sp.]|uniref:DUF4038 domain-containing protein n=1 Tax=Ignisphaera aggregans TaxID=334771 RepID=A0A832CWF0_9CREN
MGKRISVSSEKDYFIRDNKKFFYLADTCWSAFTNIPLDEWFYYLNYRAMQGFNVIQINILSQHDRSDSPYYIDPFIVKPNGEWNFNEVNEKYFDRAEKMIEIAVEKGFTPGLVVLWCNYVPGTWGSRLVKPQRIIPRDALENYVEYVVDRFSKYNPIFIISGDTNFESPEAEEYYLRAMEVVKRKTPLCLTTMHLMGAFWQLPQKIVESSYYDFYMFQSGHTGRITPYELAQKFYELPIKRPIVNGEPCYEGIAGRRYYKHSRFDVRKAIWQSLLSGAKAGIAYGALGIWNWHRRNSIFYGEDFSGPSYDWRTALMFPGANDAAFAKHVFEYYDLFDIKPANDLLINETNEIRVAKGKEKVVVYVPYSWRVKLNLESNSYTWIGIDLDSRKMFNPEVLNERAITIVEIPEINNDYLLIGFEV